MTDRYPEGTLPTAKMRALALDIAERNAQSGNKEAVAIFLRMAGATTRTIRRHMKQVKEMQDAKKQ